MADQSMFLDADLKQLRPAADGVWTIRSTAPPPGIRVFGAFAATDWFVALHWSLRNALGDPGSVEWDEAIKVTQHKWRQLFPSYPPSPGVDLHDYLSKHARKAVP
jgi:hypothetical protein